MKAHTKSYIPNLGKKKKKLEIEINKWFQYCERVMQTGGSAGIILPMLMAWQYQYYPHVGRGGKSLNRHTCKLCPIHYDVYHTGTDAYTHNDMKHWLFIWIDCSTYSHNIQQSQILISNKGITTHTS